MKTNIGKLKTEFRVEFNEFYKLERIHYCLVILRNLIAKMKEMKASIDRDKISKEIKELKKEIRREARKLYFHQYHDRIFKDCFDNLELRFIVSNKTAPFFFGEKQKKNAFCNYYRACFERGFFDRCFESLRLFKSKRRDIPEHLIRNLYMATKGENLQTNFDLTNYYREFFSREERVESFLNFYRLLRSQENPVIADIVRKNVLATGSVRKKVINQFDNSLQENKSVLLLVGRVPEIQIATE